MDTVDKVRFVVCSSCMLKMAPFWKGNPFRTGSFDSNNGPSALQSQKFKIWFSDGSRAVAKLIHYDERGVLVKQPQPKGEVPAALP